MKSEKMSPNIIKPKLLILGPLPPPFMGPSVTTEILINSDLKNFLIFTTLTRAPIQKLVN